MSTWQDWFIIGFLFGPGVGVVVFAHFLSLFDR